MQLSYRATPQKVNCKMTCSKKLLRLIKDFQPESHLFYRAQKINIRIFHTHFSMRNEVTRATDVWIWGYQETVDFYLVVSLSLDLCISPQTFFWIPIPIPIPVPIPIPTREQEKIKKKKGENVIEYLYSGCYADNVLFLKYQR